MLLRILYVFKETEILFARLKSYRCLDDFVKEKKKEFDCETGHKSFIAAKIFGITSTTPK